MNFNKYHVSRNLCLVSQNNSIYYAALNKYSVNNNSVTVTGEALFGFICKALPNTNYTVSAYADTIGAQLRIREYSGVPTEWSTNFVNQPINKQLTTYSDASFTTGSLTNYFLVVFYTPPTTTHINIFNIMLNTGSTALPYEPYSSEVLHDTPHYIHKTSTDTLTLPAVLYPNDTTATVGLKGNTAQNGTPTPQNPVMPNGTGERTGNLFDKTATNVNNGYISNGYLRSDGNISTNIDYRVSEYIRISQNQPYILYYGSNLNLPSVCFYDSSKNYISGVAYSGRWDVPFTTPQNAEYLRLSFRAVDVDNIKLNEGSTALPYEPYGYKLDISSASTTTPVYLGEVETTREIRKLVLTGEETSWYASSGFMYNDTIQPDYLRSTATTLICSHYRAIGGVVGGGDVSNGQCAFYRFPGVQRLYIRDNNYTAAEDFKIYLQQQYAAGTPVTVWYVLATPKTAVVNEPIRKIGEYADEVSNISIPVTAGGDTISVDTTVQPSGVTIDYKGWHPVQSVHEKSRNLFDKSSDVVGYYISSVNGAWTQTGSTSRSVLIKCESNTTYTISVPTNRTLSAEYFNNSPSAGDVGYGLTDNTTENYVNKTLTITTGSSAQYLAFFCYNSSQEATMYDEAEYFSQIMLNEGSSALPYEPYWT